jgi:nucleoside-diphosphate-sugar epimerase
MTGASGWIGAPSVRALVANGHEVVGLARTAASAAAVTAAGATPVTGSLDDLDLLRSQAAASDGVVHLAFRHDIAFTGDYLGAVESDRLAIEAFGEALAGTQRPLVIASGVPGLGADGRPGTEQDRPDASFQPRIGNANLALALADRGLRSVVVRFAPTVHGEGDGGFIASLVGIARDKRVSGYVGDGSTRWPAVHVSDAADLVGRAVERAAAGSALHATAEPDIATREIAEAIGRQLDLPTESVPLEQADAHFGFLGRILASDIPATSELTQQLLDWHPSGPTLLEDIDAGHYT